MIKHFLSAHSSSILFCIFIFVCSPLSQAEEFLSQEELTKLTLAELFQVTIATGHKQKISDAPAIVSVITEKEIALMGATNIDEVLESVPGLHVIKDKLTYRSIYTIRGIFSYNNAELLLMINNIPIKSVFQGNQGEMWTGMSVKAIKRIEIIRGPGSSVYGADAFAGVINIITKTKEDIEGTEVGTRIESFNTQDAWLLHGNRYGDFDVAFAVEYYKTDGHKEIIEADLQTQFDQLFNTDVSYAPGPVSLSKRDIALSLDVAYQYWRLRSAFQGHYNVGVGAGDSQVLDPNGRLAEENYSTDLTYHNPQFTENWDITVQTSVRDFSYAPTSNQILFPPGAFGGAYPEGYIGNPGISERHSRIDLSAFYSGFDQQAIRIGTGFYFGDLYDVTHIGNFGIDPATGEELPPGTRFVDGSDTPYAFLPEKSRKNYYVFLQDVYQLLENWELTTGIRYDHYSDFGNTTNPRLALVWQTHPHFTTKLLYGQSFRAPNFAELYLANNPIAHGNTTLTPEKIKTIELAVDYHPIERFNIVVNLFKQMISDKIQVDYTQDISLIGEAGSKGFEIEMRWQPNNQWYLITNYSYQTTTDFTKTHSLGNMPRHQVYLDANWQPISDWNINTRLNWIGERTRVYGDIRTALSDYAMLDFTIRYGLLPDIEKTKMNWYVAFSVRNSLDDDIREPSVSGVNGKMAAIPYDLPQAGRNYLLEIGYQFK